MICLAPAADETHGRGFGASDGRLCKSCRDHGSTAVNVRGQGHQLNKRMWEAKAGQFQVADPMPRWVRVKSALTLAMLV